MLNTREKLIELLDDAFINSDANYGMPSTKQVADHLIANGVTIPMWIPVTERLPEKWQNVIACRADKKYRFDFIGSWGNWYEDVNEVGNPVTHWMPLPQPPKGE